MTGFSLPFSIEHPNPKDFILAKCYETKQECYKLTIPAGKSLAEPIYVRFKATDRPMDFSLGIELQKNASAVIVEDWDNEIKSPAIRFTSHVRCRPGSDLKYIVINGISEKSVMTEIRTSDVAANAKCHMFAHHFGSKKLSSRLTQTASGHHAEINTNIIAQSSHDQELSFYCEHDYAEKMGSGEISMKGIARDKAALNFDGMIRIRQTGGGSAGYLKQETLNLSPNTRVHAIPGLQIDTNDVKAGHSAAVRNLNEEDLFYFGARGINQEVAKKLLITGFFGKELKKIEPYRSAYETIRKLI